MSAAEEVIPSELPKPAKRVQNRTGRVQNRTGRAQNRTRQNRTGRKQVRPSRAEEMQAKRKQQKEEAIDTRRTQRQPMIVSEELMADSAQVAAQHKRTVQDAVFPTSDADRKRVTRSVAAQVAAQHKRTVQDAVFPTSSAERMRFTRQQARQARERNAAEATAAIAAEAGAAAEDGVDSAGATKTQRAQARIAPFKRSFHEALSKRSLHQALGSAQPGPVVFQDATMEGAAQSGLEAVKHFFDNGGMRRNTCGCCNELKSPSQTRTVAIEEGGPWITRLKKRLSWVYTLLRDWTCHHDRSQHSIEEILQAMHHQQLAHRAAHQ